MAARLPSRRVDARHCPPSLQPLAGILLSLWRAEQEVQEQSADQPAADPAAGRPARRQSLVAALNRQAALTSDVLQGLLEAEVGCRSSRDCTGSARMCVLPAVAAAFAAVSCQHANLAVFLLLCSCTKRSRCRVMPRQ